MADLTRAAILSTPQPSFLRSAFSATIDWPLRVVLLRLQTSTAPPLDVRRVSEWTHIPEHTLSYMNYAGGVAWVIVAAFLHKAALDISSKFDLDSPVGDIAGAASAPFSKLASVISEWDRSRSSAASTGIEAKQDYASIFRVGNHLFSLMNGTSFGNMLASFGMRTAAEVITYPIASIMTRIAVQPNVPANKLLKYIDPRQTFQTILNEEGFAGLYKGFSSQVVSNAIGAVIPYVASKIFEPAIDEMAAAWNKVQLRFSDHAKQTGGVVVQTDSQKSALSKIVKHYWEELNQPRVIGLGLLSAAVYAGFMPLSYSFALLSTRLRVHGMDIFPQHYFGFHPHMNLMDMISSIYDTEGVYGLVRGSLWKFLWSQLTTGAILVRSFYKPTVWVQ